MESLFGFLHVFNGYPESYDNFLFLDFPFKEREFCPLLPPIQAELMTQGLHAGLFMEGLS